MESRRGELRCCGGAFAFGGHWGCCWETDALEELGGKGALVSTSVGLEMRNWPIYQKRSCCHCLKVAKLVEET